MSNSNAEEDYYELRAHVIEFKRKFESAKQLGELGCDISISLIEDFFKSVNKSYFNI